MKSKIFFVILLFFCLKSIAQYKIASTSVMGKKTVVVTKYDKGFVVKTDNARLEGLIQLKIVNEDTIEVRYKDASKKKTKFKREELKSYGLITLVEDVRVAKVTEKNFNPGYVITNDGQKKEGSVAFRFAIESGAEIGRRWFVRKVLFAQQEEEYSTYTVDDIKTVVQIIDNNEVLYERYQNGFTKLLNKGDLELYQNPYSTSENSFATGLISEVQQDVAEEVAEATLRTAIKTGKGSLENVKDNYDAVNSADISVSKKEYLVREKGTDTFIILSSNMYTEWAQEYFSTCEAFNKLEAKEQKTLVKWKNITDGISFFNENCR